MQPSTSMQTHVRFLGGRPCSDSNHFKAADPASGCVTTRPWETDVASEASFAAVREWIHRCLSRHKQCIKAPLGELRSAKLTIRGRAMVDMGNYKEFELVLDKPEDVIEFATNKASRTLILLQLIRSEILKSNHQLRPRGLVLERIGDSGLYRRIGIFRMIMSRALGGDRTALFDSAVLQDVTII